MGFFKTMLASLAGMLIGGVLLILIFIFMFTAALESSLEDLAGKSDRAYTVKNESVLHLKLDHPIHDNGPIEDFNFGLDGLDNSRTDGLNSIVESIDRAAKDEKIKGIYLQVKSMDAGMATVQEIRNALMRFKSSKKFIVAFAEYYDTKSYYLCSVADHISCFPDGLPAFIGLSSQSYFLKGMLDKLDIDMSIIRGSNNKFKSAVEPLMSDHMSEANRQQVSRYLNVLWGSIRKAVSESRNISEDELDRIADSVKVTNAHLALEHKLIDAVQYEDEFMDMLAKKAGWKSSTKPRLVSLHRYLNDKRIKIPVYGTARAVQRKADAKNDQIAVIYASGDIIDGKGGNDVIGSVTLSKHIRKARLNKKVKAIVLRIDSPGGSALASEVIWRETQLAKREKPVIVSMGDLAASGGYYIACGADRIYAQPTTLTGSIGVFGVLPHTERFFKNKMGITFDRVRTNAHADMGSVIRPMDETEFKIIQKEVDHIYDTFTKRVSDGRKLDQQLVKDSIGQGRVWTGVDALELGLVDSLGNLDDAIRFAAHKAKLKKYIVRSYPRIVNPIEQFFMEIGKDEKDQSDETAAWTALIQQHYANALLPQAVTQALVRTARMLQHKGVYTYCPWYTSVE